MFVALGFRLTMRMRHIVICGMSGSTIFSHEISQMIQFSKTIIEHNFFKFSPQFLPEIFHILRRNERDVKNVWGPSCVVPVTLVRF